jgi:ABC-2 type transport system ATP-binding protein
VIAWLRASRARVVVLVVAVVALAVSAASVASARSAGLPVAEQPLRVPVGPEPDGSPVDLDAAVYTATTSATDRKPAVLLAHGFGGQRQDLDGQARRLAQEGYVVLTWTARGFGQSGGRIHLNAPGYEVADVDRLVDLLAARDDVLIDADGDPRVGIAGGSYGGAIALLAAGYDRRVDAIAPRITWNDLAQSLFPQFASDGEPSTAAAFDPVAAPGVFKRLWAGVFFGSGSASETDPTVCGRFADDVCDAYSASAASGVPTPEILSLLRASSPASVLDRIDAPTLILQGQADSLFPLSEGDANARGIAADGTPVKLVWFAGGHDGGDQEEDRLDALTLAWFDRYLSDDGTPTDTRFEATGQAASLFGARTGADPQVLAAPEAPGVDGSGAPARRDVPLSGEAQTVVAPAGGNPAQVSSLPGLGAVVSTLLRGSQRALPDIPGQSAVFETAPVAEPFTLVGSATAEIEVRTDAPDVTLFAKLLDVGPGGAEAVLPNRLVTTVRWEGGGSRTVRVVLPAVVREIQPGHSLRLVLSTTDQGYAMPAEPRTYEVAPAGSGTLSLPVVEVAPLPSDSTGLLVGTGIVVLLLLGVGAAAAGVRRRSKHVAEDVDAELVDVPLVVRGLGKEYAGGFRAVSDVSFRVEQGQVLGLLGPNGAGKTTVLRMLLGLIRPTEGELLVFGHRVTPGAPVLSRLGAFVEGPGLLPHLSGRANLELFWRVTGRPMEEAYLDTVLEVAGLGVDAERKVRTYSQGMRARIAIAQAMLGLPELLVLDEPTNGLDPPQIREVREVLRTYADTGRTVVVSSHLLAEVERTCTHVVVMHRGELVAAGPLDQVVAADAEGAEPADLETVFLGLIGASA